MLQFVEISMDMWTHKKKKLFKDLWKRNECLYNKHNPSYNNSSKRQNAITEISTHVDMSCKL